VLGRNTQGVRLIRLAEGERLVGIERVESLDAAEVASGEVAGGDVPGGENAGGDDVGGAEESSGSEAPGPVDGSS
jgi:DNA gyrase subunit A